MNNLSRHITLCANDFSSGSSQYAWDANGNLVSDSGKGVVSVSYNRFNLPVAVDLGDRGDITFTYDGLGRKLSMASRPKLTINPLAKSAPKEINGGKIDGGKIDGGKIDGDFPIADIDLFSRYYYDNLIFKGTQLERILFPGGYITPSGTEYIYHYYVTDRQGNVRAVVRDGNLVEANDYYPYGMLMADADGKIPDKQPYKLSGKEYITTRGLNLYDFGARMHDPAAMRFSTPDPVMEQYPSLSPYTYCAANPMKYIDPTGMRLVNSATGKYYCYIENIIAHLRNDSFFGSVITYLENHNQAIPIRETFIKSIDGEPQRFGSFNPITFEIGLHIPEINLDFECFPNRNNCYTHLSEELYHAYQELTKEYNEDSIEFEAHVAALFGTSSVVGGFMYASGVQLFIEYVEPPFVNNKWYSIFIQLQLVCIRSLYQVGGNQFFDSFRNSKTNHYADPVNHMPKRLYNLIINSYEKKTCIDKSVLNQF